MRILIVEDEAIVAMGLRANLETLGHTVVAIASTGEAAEETAIRCDLDLILMDIRLGGDQDGIDVAKRIRTRLPTHIVFITAYADDAAVQRASELEPLGYLVKPVDFELLKEIIDTVAQALPGRLGDSRTV